MNLFYSFYDKKVNSFLIIVFLLFSFSSNGIAQINSADWDLNTTTARNISALPAIPSTSLNTAISIEKFKQKLHSEKQEIQVPNPDGQFETFVIEPTDVVGSEVVHLYTIKTFKGYKKDNPTVLFAGDISDNGFHASVYAGQNTYFIEPINTNPNAANQLKVYYKRESKANKVKCLVEKTARQAVQSKKVTKRSAPTQKRNFRLAIVATGEFGQEFGGTPYNATNVLNALASGVNMINPIYLRDVGIDFTLVSTAAMVFEDPDADAFDINDEDGFFENLTSTIENAIGVSEFDVGHAVIWDNLGGLASAGVVCDDISKSEGYSAASSSTVTLWVDYVAHEIGHQFNADHNFVSTECETSVDGVRYEPGEGSSIMAYAGVCGAPAEFAAGSDPFFHYASIKTMTDFVETVSCGTITSSGNSSDPVSNAQSDITIPKQTPFVLVGSASDANDAANNITYSWEQYDGNSNAVNGPPDCNATNAPLFRFRPPNSTGIRSFPQYTDVLAGNNNTMDWEKLPCTARDINFSLAVRDNNPVFGRVTNDLMKITVANTGPFEVTTPNGGETLTGNMASTITWTVNGTDAHCSNVDILLSTDGGGTFTVIADATANDGTESVMIPNSASTTARIIIRCDVTGGFRSASTFYDVSNAAFTITEGATSACANNGGDADMDGICADVDCNDNDANIGAKQAVGTTCDDGNSNTENDQIQADGCSCAGTVIPACANNGGDADNDGICADNDCNDNDASIGAKQAAGTVCDDGNSNTENDQIQADGCSCAGTAIPACANNGGDADNDGICADNDCNDNDASIGAKQAVGTTCDDGNSNTENDQIQADGCSCAGTAIPVCANNGGDVDNDGICADNDCNDNDASIGAKQAVGTTCDDSNENTENDQIQADGCSCAGTVIPACADNGGDADNDGFCANVDCDDNNPNINPMAIEIPDNDIDENCDGMDGMTTGMGDACPAPSTAQVTNLSNRKTLLEWSNVEMANNYTLQVRFKGQASWLVTATIPRNRVFVYAPSGLTYEYRLKSNCANEESEYSAIFEYSTPTNFTESIADSRNNDEAEKDAIYLNEARKELIQLYPNPVQGRLNLQLGANKEGAIAIYHTSGSLISHQQIIVGQSIQQIEVNHLDAGLYFIRVEETGKQAVSKRFVKM